MDENEEFERPVEFRTVMYLTIALGAGMALLIHFVVLSSPAYNIFGG